MAKIIVNTTEVSVLNLNGEDYICLTDMMKAKDGEFFVTDWLRNRNTLEYIGIWEKIYNPNFNYGEFAIIRNQAGLNRFKISVKDFVQRTNAISLQSKAGRYGGTYAHKDIAFEFAMWISPEFKIYMVKEFQRLKAEEQAQLGWSAKRELSKINYRIHTDAIKHNLIPTEITPAQASLIYANEADVLNVAMNKVGDGVWQVEIPAKYRVGHEAHFGQVTEHFLDYLKEGKLPDWEVPNMLAKYYTTTSALDMAKAKTK
jgi:hypothetical protein